MVVDSSTPFLIPDINGSAACEVVLRVMLLSSAKDLRVVEGAIDGTNGPPREESVESTPGKSRETVNKC